MLQKYLEFENKIDFVIAVSKIMIISLMAVFLLGFFFPFYEYPGDSRVYGFQALQIADGIYDYENKLLSDTGYWEFVPEALVKTQHDTAIPNILPLFPAIGAFFYKIFGLPGLFYLNPILTITFLIISERITSKIFGKHVGLLVLIFLSTNEMVFWVGRGLLTSMLFSNFFLLGTFFLFKFFKTRSDIQILIASIFFTLTAFIRPNGIIFVPIEIGIIIAYFGWKKINENGKKSKKTDYSKNKVLKISLFTVGPWLVFVIFMLIFNSYYFGDPTTTFYNVPDSPEWSSQKDYIGEINSDAIRIDLERIEKYSIHFLPYPINRVIGALNYNDSTSGDENFSTFIDSLQEYELISHLGLASFSIIGLALFLSIKLKNYRMEIMVYSIFIVSMIIFYSTQFIAMGRQGSARDMLPVFPLFYGLLGYLIVKIIKSKREFGSKTILFKSSKIILVLLLIMFIPTSFYFADYSQILKKKGFDLNNPSEYVYPTISDSILEKDIIVTVYKFDQVIRHGSITFSPIGVSNNFDSNNPSLIKMLEKLNDVLSNDEQRVFIFKEPGRENEKVFHKYLDELNKYYLTDHDKDLCKIELKEEQNRKSDLVCLD